jgi:hypothetical protein
MTRLYSTYAEVLLLSTRFIRTEHDSTMSRSEANRRAISNIESAPEPTATFYRRTSDANARVLTRRKRNRTKDFIDNAV